MKVFTAIVALASTSIASAAVIWDGRFSDYSVAVEFNAWSWSNQVGSYQTYIYGNLHGEKASSWLTLGSQYKNPAHRVIWEGRTLVYADIKYGQLSGQNGVADTLRVITGGNVTIWSLTPVKGTWYNFILGTGSPGGLWVSTGSNPLQKVYSGSLNGNGGNDWHVGALRLPINGNRQVITEEKVYYSGIYVEDSGPTLQP